MMCPCCGQPIRDVGFKVSLEFNTVIIGTAALEVEPRQAELLYVLRSRYPNTVSKSSLLEKVWGRNPVDDSGLRQLVYKARKSIEPFGYTIRPETARGYNLAKLSTSKRKVNRRHVARQDA